MKKRFIINPDVPVGQFLRKVLVQCISRGMNATRRRYAQLTFAQRTLFQADDALQVQSTALVSDEFLVNADVLVADFARNMLDEYVDRGCDAVRRRRVD